MNTFLLCVGAQKSGTTWLADILSRNSDIYVPEIKELHYWDAKYSTHLSGGWDTQFEKKIKNVLNRSIDNGFISERDQKILLESHQRINMLKDDDYKQFFVDRTENITCDFTPSYSFLPLEAFERLEQLKISSEIKVIFLMRNPANRFWSSITYGDLLLDGNRDHGAVIENNLKNEHHVSRSNYINTIQNLESVFSKFQIHYEFYENLFTDKAFNKISRFLDIKLSTPDYTKVVNKSKAGDVLSLNDREKLVSFFSDQYQYIYDKFSYVPSSWKDDMDQFL